MWMLSSINKQRRHLQIFVLVLLASSLAVLNAFQPIPRIHQTGFLMQKVRPRTGTQSSSSSSTQQQDHRPRLTSDIRRRQDSVSLQLSSSNSQQPSYGRPGPRNQLTKDVVIIGGGLAGLSVALYLSQIDPNRHVTILDKEDVLEMGQDGKQTAVSSFAAAGMLAPHSERLPKGSYLDLCLRSKAMYPEFCDMVEYLARESGEEGLMYLPPKNDNDSSDHNLEPWNIGYVGAGGFLAPAFAGDNVATWAPPEDSSKGGKAKWLDSYQVRELEPNLDPKVVGGWWFPEDSSVDARRLTSSLRAACVGVGVQYLSGANYEVASLDLTDGHCNGLWLKNGKYISTKTVLVANGAWMRTLLPVPLEPHKGQSLSLRMPKDRPPILRRVLFAQDSYIVPKADGRIVIGATVEAGSFDPNVTPAGIMHILSYALELVPALADLPLEETWAGLRPTTPDKGPIIGETPWDNLFLAGGYWRNGVLLAPKTGELLASLIAGVALSDEDQRFLKEFAWDRFTARGKGASLAANARFAASMYPVHSRKSGVGVAAAVGTELGSYSTARSAGEERAKDRDSLWGSEDDAFERAANLGKEDGTAFSFGDDDEDDYSSIRKKNSATSSSSTTTIATASKSEVKTSNPTQSWAALLESAPGEVVKYDGSPDALTVGYSEEDTNSKNGDDLQSTYASIQKNKADQSVQLDLESNSGDEKPDPGFRIYHVNQKTGKRTEVPPYTSPGDFLASIDEDTGPKTVDEERRESFDGYSTILDAAAKDNNIRQTMKKARMSNRFGGADESIKMDIDFSTPKSAPSPAKSATPKPADASGTTSTTTTGNDLSSMYQKIRDQKTASTATVGDQPDEEERPDPGFRIYHVDKDGKNREVPPYTSPGEFLESIQKQETGAPAVNGIAKVATPSPQPETNGLTTPEGDDYSEKTYDGYQDIIEANASISREDELKAMREARRANRIGQETISDSDLN